MESAVGILVGGFTLGLPIWFFYLDQRSLSTAQVGWGRAPNSPLGKDGRSCGGSTCDPCGPDRPDFRVQSNPLRSSQPFLPPPVAAHRLRLLSNSSGFVGISKPFLVVLPLGATRP